MRHVQPVVAVVLSRVSSCNLHMVGTVFFVATAVPLQLHCAADTLPASADESHTLSHPGHLLVQQQLVADGSAE